MSTRDIRPSLHHTVCDVCGRTLLRGEHAEAYIDGGERRWVCDLCVTRALEDGWVREGTAPEVDRTDYPRERRRPLRQLLRGLRPSSRETDGDVGVQGDRLVHETSLPAPAPEGPREPRHVHAVPTSAEQRVSSAVRVFNGSEHTRTIAGVARSLGPPEVTVKPSDVQPAVVWLVAAWELCWYRYEIDLADEQPSVRVAAQGSELDELEPVERDANARADEDGVLALS